MNPIGSLRLSTLIVLIGCIPISAPSAVAGHDDASIELIARTRPAVVNIEAKSPLSTRMGPLGDLLSKSPASQQTGDRTKWYTSVASGVIWDSIGHIVTTASLIQDAEQISVRLISGDVYPAQLVGKDEETNLAVLQITSETRPQFPHLSPRDSNLPEGAWVALLGYGIGGVPSIATGVAGIPPEQFDPNRNWFQFTAPVRPGNSGSALIDSNGHLAGIVLGREEDSGFQAVIHLLTRQSSSSESHSPGSRSNSISNFGIAIPIAMASDVIREIIASGNYVRGWIGVIVEADNTGKSPCLRITDIVEGSPADDAGLNPGDRLLKIDDQELSLPSELGRLVTRSNIGRKLPLVYERSGTRQTLELEIRPKPDRMPQISEKVQKTKAVLTSRDLGIQIDNMTPALRQHLKAPQNNGVLVVDVTDTGILHHGDVSVGDIITHLSGRVIKSVDEFNEQLNVTDLKGATHLTIFRNGNQLQVSIPLYKLQTRGTADTMQIDLQK